jgi:hypothetical protein
MKIGVTGTRSGMNDNQMLAVIKFLQENTVNELHHGDCVGVDFEVAEIAATLGIRTVCHPPNKTELRAYHKSDETRFPLTYFARNRNIVDETDMLLVVPYQDTHQPNGGTWYTHDYAVKKGKERRVFFPNTKSQE